MVTDLEAAERRLNGVTKIEILTDGEYAVGTTWRETRQMMGRSETMTLVVSDVEAPRRTCVSAQQGGIDYLTCFELAEHPQGTQLTVTFSGQQSNPRLVHRVLWTIFGRLGLSVTRKALEQDLSDIAAAAELAS